MAGHSKWAKTKRMKAVVDAKRGKIFSRLSRDITMTAKAGGGDPTMNPRLRTLLLKAKEANMPADNVDRAIKKGTGELPGVSYEEIVYEGYGPGGVALILQVTTDNKNRSASEVRSTFTKHGGNLASTGSVAFQFHHLGQFLLARDSTTEDALMEIVLDAGAEDIRASDDGFEILCPIPCFDKVSRALEEKGLKPESAEIAYLPSSTVPVNNPDTARAIIRLHDALDELDDVQGVYSNEEFDEATSAAIHE